VNYLLARGGQQKGPYSIEDLQRMMGEGSAAAADLVWREGMPTWVPLISVLPVATAASPGVPPELPTFTGDAGAGKQASEIPEPPSMHWAVVLGLGLVTFGGFWWAWTIVEGNYVKRLDPKNRFMNTFVVTGYVMTAFVAAWIVALCNVAYIRPGQEMGIGNPLVIADLFGVLLCPGSLIIYFMAMPRMRRSIEGYFGDVEPIRLRLNPGMSICLGIFYFQDSFRRIAVWKKTGVWDSGQP
jgi:hypothetical protein